jgi:hypothetical protein
MHTAAFVFFALAQATLAVFAIRQYRRTRSLWMLMLCLPIAGVVWDNAIMALGSVIGDGPMLVALSWPRFIGHALLTPAWIVAAIGIAAYTGAGWARGRGARVGEWALYGFAALAGVLRYVVFLDMAPVSEGGMFYYTNVGTFPGPPIGSITMLLVVLACGFVVWRRSKLPWVLVGSLSMLLTQVVPRELVGFLVTNSGEVIRAASLVITATMLHRAQSPNSSIEALLELGEITEPACSV